MSVFYYKTREWHLGVRNRLSPEHSQRLMDLIRGKRVLDVGDEQSPFFAGTLAGHAARWTMVGRLPPLRLFSIPPRNVVVTNAKFTTELGFVKATEIDIILLAFPSPDDSQHVAAAEWATTAHLIVFAGNAPEEAACGSPDFWRLVEKATIEADAKDQVSRLLIFRKKPPGAEAAGVASATRLVEELRKSRIQAPNPLQPTSEPNLPRKGDRYHLSPSCNWPNKKSGERPPVVEIDKDWTQRMGPVKFVQTGEVFAIRLPDLGGQL